MPSPDLLEDAVGELDQLRRIASTMLIAIVKDEYQHRKWISEIRTDTTGLDAPPLPSSPRLSTVDGYVMLTDPA